MIFLCRRHLSNRPRSCPFALCSVLCRTGSGRVDYLSGFARLLIFSEPGSFWFPGRSFSLAAIPCSIARSSLLCCHHYHLGFARFSAISLLAHIALNAAAAFLFVLRSWPPACCCSTPSSALAAWPSKSRLSFCSSFFCCSSISFLTPGPVPVFRAAFFGSSSFCRER